jgi:hypothetical protein
MPLLLPKQRANRREANFSGQPVGTWGTVLTSHTTTAHTYPTAYTELIASTAFDTDWVNLNFHTNFLAANDTDSIVTIYAGAGGSEQILIADLLAGWTNILDGQGLTTKTYGFPLRIPQGTRLSGRHRSVRTTAGVNCMMELLGGGEGHHWTGTRVEGVGLGAAGTDSGGTLVTPGTTSEGTFTTVGSATVYDWGYVVPMNGGNTDTVQPTDVIAADLGVGGVALTGLDEWLFHCFTTEVNGPLRGQIGRYTYIPAGTTLQLRVQALNSTDAKDFAIYGVA